MMIGHAHGLPVNLSAHVEDRITDRGICQGTIMSVIQRGTVSRSISNKHSLQITYSDITVAVLDSFDTKIQVITAWKNDDKKVEAVAQARREKKKAKKKKKMLKKIKDNGAAWKNI